MDFGASAAVLVKVRASKGIVLQLVVTIRSLTPSGLRLPSEGHNLFNVSNVGVNTCS